jgi:hypothetical protein
MKDAVTFAVVDDGIGIPYDQQSSIFSTYAQIDANKNQDGKGTGIGLSICKETILKHGGNIGFRSIPSAGPRMRMQEDNIPTYHRISSGTIFYFYLPLPVLIPSTSSIKNIHLKSSSRVNSYSMNDFFALSSPPTARSSSRFTPLGAKMVSSRSNESMVMEESSDAKPLSSVPINILGLHHRFQNELHRQQDVYNVMNDFMDHHHHHHGQNTCSDEDDQPLYMDYTGSFQQQHSPISPSSKTCLIVDGKQGYSFS